ncbi:hypothetical protein ACFC1T_08140 [Kitasatospora sp. NPDC056076]|uniref:hypothetical protein n=1 Tax=Kitasatospora sp. NPDC056076 TaxID=3345703 RepID=UPI0035D85564
MNKTMRNVLAQVFLVAAMAASYWAGVEVADHRAPEPNVFSFNDGFRDAKWDDCQQGYAAACDWLHDRR